MGKGRQAVCPISFTRAAEVPVSSCQAGSLWGRWVCHVRNCFLQLKERGRFWRKDVEKVENIAPVLPDSPEG